MISYSKMDFVMFGDKRPPSDEQNFQKPNSHIKIQGFNRTT
jgi:hypothetical protein